MATFRIPTSKQMEEALKEQESMQAVRELDAELDRRIRYYHKVIDLQRALIEGILSEHKEGQ